MYLGQQEGGISLLGLGPRGATQVSQLTGINMSVVVVVLRQFHSHPGEVLGAIKLPEVGLRVPVTSQNITVHHLECIIQY